MLSNFSISDLFMNSAYADTASATPQQGGGSSLLIMMLVFLAFIYLTVWRPQNKRAKEQRLLLDSLVKDDEVLTTGGIIGKIIKVSDAYVVIAVSDNQQLTVQKSAIATALPKGTLKSVS